MEVAMNTIIANVLMNEAAKARTSRGASSYKIVLLSSCIGLFASLFMLALGVDVSGAGPL
jgi:hypothetical protein